MSSVKKLTLSNNENLTEETADCLIARLKNNWKVKDLFLLNIGISLKKKREILSLYENDLIKNLKLDGDQQLHLNLSRIRLENHSVQGIKFLFKILFGISWVYVTVLLIYFRLYWFWKKMIFIKIKWTEMNRYSNQLRFRWTPFHLITTCLKERPLNCWSISTSKKYLNHSKRRKNLEFFL